MATELQDTFREIGKRLEADEARIAHKTAISQCVMALSVNSEGVIGYATPPLAKQFGWLDRELDGKLMRILVPERFRDAHDEHIKRFFERPVSRQMGAGDGDPGTHRTLLYGWNERSQKEFLVVIGLEPQNYLERNWAIATLALPLQDTKE